MSDIGNSERGSALDRFAASNVTPPAAVPAAEFGSGGLRVVGAQKLAVQRDESRVLQRLKVLAAAAGDDWYYRFPVKERRSGKISYVEGPSVKLANDLARLYGNDEVETRVLDLGDSWLIYARFTDYESGFSLTRPFQQRKSQRSVASEDSDRVRDIAFQIGVSKAIRNVTVNALQTFADFAFEEAKNALVEKIGKDLPRYRDRTVERLAANVEIKRVEAVVGRSVHDWLATDVASVIAQAKAISDGFATWDETFPPLESKGSSGQPEPSQLDKLADAPDDAADSGAVKPSDTEPSPPPASTPRER